MRMPYVTSIERLAKAEGRAEGKAEGRVDGRAEGKAEGKADTLLQILELRLTTEVPADLAVTVRATRDLRQLERWVDVALQANSLDEFRRLAQI
jgi:predicted transposase YdaD